MKKTLAACLILIFTVSLAGPAYCNGPMRKLERGICNLFTFPFEIYNQTEKTAEVSGIGKAMTYGLAKGVYMMGFRALAGIYEVVTFPFPVPKGYEPVLKDPEFFLGSPD